MAAAGAALPPAPAGALELDGGVCVLRIEVTSSDVPLVPDARTWQLDGGGTCTTTKGVDLPTTVDGQLSEVVADEPTVGCASAVLLGQVRLIITADDYSPIDLTTVAAVAGSVVHLTGALVPNVAATGEFLQDPSDSVDCVTDLAIDSTTWCGALAFGDPSE